MSIAETLMSVNSQGLSTPLNHLIWLNDYKTYGTNSYVYNDKDILHEMYESPISINDISMQNEVISYATSKGVVGKILQGLYGVNKQLDWSTIYTLDDILYNDEILDYILSVVNPKISDICMRLIVNSESTMNTICSSQDHLLRLYNSPAVIRGKFVSSPHLLTSCQKSPLYEVIKKSDGIDRGNRSARRIHYANKCFIVGVSQYEYSSGGCVFLVDTINGTKSNAVGNTIGTTGLIWRINEFSEFAKCHPAYFSGSSYVITPDSYMSILKIE